MEKAGSGITTEDIFRQLVEIKTKAFHKQVSSMIRPRGRGGFSKNQVEDMTAGFSDGFRSALASLVEIGAIAIVPSPTEADPPQHDAHVRAWKERQ